MSVFKEWLVEKLDEVSLDALLRHQYKKYGYGIHDDLTKNRIDKIKKAAQERYIGFAEGVVDTDQLWYFCSPDETWKQLAGRAGYAIVRDGEVIAIHTTSMN